MTHTPNQSTKNSDSHSKMIMRCSLLSLSCGFFTFLILYALSAKIYYFHDGFFFSFILAIVFSIFSFGTSLVFSKLPEGKKTEAEKLNVDSEDWFEERTNSSGPLSLDLHWNFWKQD